MHKKTLPLNLPAPSEDLLAHSEKLARCIRDEMERLNSPITFVDFMNLALYTPGLGYYAAGLSKFGKEGDFATAPEIGKLFAQCLARQCQQVLDTLGGGDILELGAGTGAMATELLLALEKSGGLPRQYFILERSAELKQRQRTLFNLKIPHLVHRVVWLDTWPDQPMTGVVLANEVLDAMPVHLFQLSDKAIQELYVKWDDGFDWHVGSPSSELLVEQIQRLGMDVDAYTSEINLQLPIWLKSLSERLSQGVILLIDYGFPRHEYYHPHRHMGTLMSHYCHRAHGDPLILVGLQDITAHVDFTWVAESAREAELHVAGFTTQAAFLLSTGLLDIAQRESVDTYQRMRINQQIHYLTTPNEMGELFKVMALTRGLEGVKLMGFGLQDQRQRLEHVII